MAPDVRVYLKRAVARPDGIKLMGQFDHRSFSRVASVLKKAGCRLDRRRQVWVHPDREASAVLADLVEEDTQP